MQPLQFLKLGGPIVGVILAASVLALAAFLERIIRFHQAHIDADRFLREIEAFLREKNLGAALRHCDLCDSPVARIVKIGISHLREPRERLRGKLEEASLIEVPELEKHVGILAVVAQVSTLLGLLGTVTGMVKTFQAIARKGAGVVDPALLAGGIWEALITTVVGLMVAIPVLVAYRYLEYFLNRIKFDMERAVQAVLNFA